jgi:hypothetical protein
LKIQPISIAAKFKKQQELWKKTLIDQARKNRVTESKEKKELIERLKKQFKK